MSVYTIARDARHDAAYHIMSIAFSAVLNMLTFVGNAFVPAWQTVVASTMPYVRGTLLQAQAARLKISHVVVNLVLAVASATVCQGIKAAVTIAIWRTTTYMSNLA